MLHDNLLLSIQYHSDQVNNEDLYEILLTMNISRSGSREMYKTLEYILCLRLKKIAEDVDLFKKIYEMLTKSGLVSQDTLILMGKFI